MKKEKKPFQVPALAILITLLVVAAIGCDGGPSGGCDGPAPIPVPTPVSTPTPTPVPLPSPTPTPPPTATPVPPPTPIGQNGTDGHATRYWDCCKPHCGWLANVPDRINPVGTCDAGNVYNGVNDMIKSSCDGGDGYTCWNMAPYAVSDTLAYGYAAVSAAGDICGKCYQLDFKGTSFNGGDDSGSKALAGKTMIVQATNIGYDVSNGQIDLLVPGGGVGAFDACTEQWGATSDQMGERYGGFLSACKHELGWNAGHEALKSCVRQRCEDLFSKDGMADLLEGCRWFVDWFEVADNPALVFKEVSCPEALNNVSGMLP